MVKREEQDNTQLQCARLTQIALQGMQRLNFEKHVSQLLGNPYFDDCVGGKFIVEHVI